MPNRAAPRPDRARDVAAGLIVAATCAAAAWVARDYGIGTPRRMGPGFFPVVLGVVGVGLGLVIAAQGALAPSASAVRLDLRRVVCVTAAFALFAFGLERLGLVATTALACLVASAADRTARVGESIALAVGLAGALWLIFVVALGLGIPALPPGLMPGLMPAFMPAPSP